MKEKTQTPEEKNRLFFLACFLLMALGAFFRTRYLFGALEYDEIWSLENFTAMPPGKIFTQLALPNNQPLNSLWIKTAMALGLPLWGIRLHSLLASMLSLPLAGFIAYTLTGKNKTAFAGTLFFLALSLPDAVYASLARGYALQVFFLLLYSAGLTACNQENIRRFFKFLPETAVALGGVGAILTLPTSVIYLGAITLAAWWMTGSVKLPKAMIGTLAGGVCFTFLWCLGNYAQLDAARVWGTKISSWRDYFDFLTGTFGTVFSISAIFSAIWGLIREKGKRAFPERLPLLLIFILPLVSAAVTNAGPPRTYIPFCALTAILAGCGFAFLVEKLKKNLLIPLLILLGAGGFSEFYLRRAQWHQPDSCEVFQAVSRLPHHILVVHRATSGYPLMWNNQPEIFDDFVKRLCDLSPERELLMFDGPGRINGNDSQGNESVIIQSIPGKADEMAGLSCRRYRLQELAHPPQAGDFILVLFRPVPAQVLNVFLQTVLNSNISWLKLNPWLNQKPGVEYRYALLAGKVPENCSLDWSVFFNSQNAVSVCKLCP